MKRILVVTPHYLPGYKAGGPIRTLVSMVDRLCNGFQFYILTSDRDLGDAEPYSGTSRGCWQPVGPALVRYLSPRENDLLPLSRLFKAIPYDLLYLNSFFSPWSVKALALRSLGWLPPKPIVLAPRGELAPGALSLKPLKKRLYIRLAKAMRLYKGITWQASCDEEAEEILGLFGRDLLAGGRPGGSSLRVATDFTTRAISEASSERRPAKRPGEARVIFLSRISRKKNLDYALQVLSQVKGKVSFDICGPIEDGTYWQECLRLMRALPDRVEARYLGPVPPENVPRVFSQYHLFLFPTRGENFGHVILEALAAGCLVLIGDQTPWRDLRRMKIGWDLSLARPDLWEGAWDELLGMNGSQFEAWSRSARAFGKQFVEDPSNPAAIREVFLEALESRLRPGASEGAALLAPRPDTSSSL